ncbi:hypothetical protein [Petropleomorpha daqingensis]|uniref:Uncharacterized protein n=1 Tax=Petropleomorpha daqingensis TaxID=2026353 RepID=A0A853CQG1_9ACTN|nr:hypothetical protein [Petropleomorpha daqingensis]NYJ08722.1 hypothetical protein [Petropleomorpha daqingensis]
MTSTTRLVLLVVLFLVTLWCLYWQGRELSGLKRQVAGLLDDLVELRRRLRDADPLPAPEPAVLEPEPVEGPPTRPTGVAIDTWQRSLSRRLYHGGHRA